MSETTNRWSHVGTNVRLISQLASLVHRGIAALDARDDEGMQLVAVDMVGVVAEECHLIPVSQTIVLTFEERSLLLGKRAKESMYADNALGHNVQESFQRIMVELESKMRDKFYEGLGSPDGD